MKFYSLTYSKLSFILIVLVGWHLNGQNVKGRLLDSKTLRPLSNVIVIVQAGSIQTKSREDGRFNLDVHHGSQVLIFNSNDYLTKKYPLTISDSSTYELGDLFLERDMTQDFQDNILFLSEEELSEEGFDIEASTGLLQASKDIYLNRAAFDFSQVFFKVRGYDSREGTVLINGLPMNRLFNGRPQWNNWGGLNDVTRDQEFTMGLRPSLSTFGGLLGSTNIRVRPSTFRKGLRLSSSLSNRTYTGRFMATFNSGKQEGALSYSLSASRRWAKEGFIDGTLYNAYSLFASIELGIDDNQSIVLTGVYAPNKRGSSSPLTSEVFNLLGNEYNSYWGFQDGDIRNTRIRKVNEPFFMLNHFLETKKLTLNTGVAYQLGSYAKGRLGYYNAPNPDPVYYRYLPSFYINSPSGANFENANIAKEYLLKSPQIDWSELYSANLNQDSEGKSAYIQYDDTVDMNKITVASNASISITDHFNMELGGAYRSLKSENYAIITDLLGGGFHEDIDPFTETYNDLNGDPMKSEGERFNYNYSINAVEINTFAQGRIAYDNLDLFVSGSFTQTSYLREGLFLNERFENNSLGKSAKVLFSNLGAKIGLHYRFTGRHMMMLNGSYMEKAPTLQNSFINPRENNEIVSGLTSETITAADMSYLMSLERWKARITGYYTMFEEATDVNFFYYEGGVGSDFVQEAVTGIDKLHYGGELALEYQISPSVKLSAVAGYGDFSFNDDANVTINFDTSGRDEEIIHPDGFLALGKSNIKGYKLAVGPQKVYSLGIEYRDPDYWWVSMTGNFLGDNYVDISTITRTDSFYLDPETGESFTEATDEAVARLLKQEKLDDVYLLNLVGGKSWLYKGRYISLFVSVNNVFDGVFRTGGFEQSRNGNFGQMAQDNLRGAPSFGPKYWYGYGRTYFINLSISL